MSITGVDPGTEPVRGHPFLPTQGVDIDLSELANLSPGMAPGQPVALTPAAWAATDQLLTGALASLGSGSITQDVTRAPDGPGEWADPHMPRRVTLSEVSDADGDLHEARRDLRTANSEAGVAASDLMSARAERRHAVDDGIEALQALRHARTQDPISAGELHEALDGLSKAGLDQLAATRTSAHALTEFSAAQWSRRSAVTDLHAAKVDIGEAMSDAQSAPG